MISVLRGLAHHEPHADPAPEPLARRTSRAEFAGLVLALTDAETLEATLIALHALLAWYERVVEGTAQGGHDA